MSSFSVRVRGTVDAPPDTVWAILVDYGEHHPRILPKPAFESWEVVEGGVGDGTVVRVVTRVLGARRVSRLRVSVVEPGRVLREADEERGVVTTFTLDPVDDQMRTEVEIATEWPEKPGLVGFSERLLDPPMARALYRKELRLLSDYARAMT